MKQNCSSGRAARGNEICEKEVNSSQLTDYPDVMTVEQVMQVLGICRHSVDALYGSYFLQRCGCFGASRTSVKPSK